MKQKQAPKWLRAAKRPPPRCGECGWRLPQHAWSCPTRYSMLGSAESIHDTRVALAIWSAQQERLREWGIDLSEVTLAAQAGISARARQLGLETDQPGDGDFFGVFAAGDR